MARRTSRSTSGSRGAWRLCGVSCSRCLRTRSVDWRKVYERKVKPPFVPVVKAANDTSNFDKYPDSEEDLSAPLVGKDKEAFKDF
jgi:hypothetical protein